MQRKMELVQKLLEYVEASDGESRLPVPEFEGYGEGEIHYHLLLCEDAGYLVVQPSRFERPRYNLRCLKGISKLTWAGHQALDDMRDRQRVE